MPWRKLSSSNSHDMARLRSNMGWELDPVSLSRSRVPRLAGWYPPSKTDNPRSYNDRSHTRSRPRVPVTE